MKRQETVQELERQEAEEAEASFSFSKGEGVTLQHLEKSTEFNGLKGIVISDFSKGRYNVEIEGVGVKSLKHSNLRSEVSVDSLPTKDLKTILAYKNEQEFVASATEKSELQAKVLKFAPSSEALSELLSKARASENTTGAGAKRDFDSTTAGPDLMDIDDPFEPRQKRRRTTEPEQPQYFGAPKTVYKGEYFNACIVGDGTKLCRNCVKHKGLCRQHQHLDARPPGTVYYGYEGCPIAVTRDGTLCHNCSMGKKLCSQHAHLGDHNVVHNHHTTHINHNYGDGYTFQY